ncbi:MAG: hypothetical protein KIS87_12960 [Phycisphaeraceae bacterium]|nr:hypothetical protein [Phycisphaeraceae bacterium]
MSQQQEQQSFWAIIELMGHQRMAGLVTETTFAGCGMLRVDVPAGDDGQPAFSRLVAPTAVYAINPVTEEIAREMTKRYRPRPVQAWDLPSRQLPAPAPAGPDDDEDLDL